MTEKNVKLKISKNLSLPIDAVTSTIVVYGGKGMGKTNLASVLVEEFAAARLRFAVVDPMGVWWGLRHSVDGKGHGIEVLILGGIHGDLPIEPTSGSIVADLVVDESVSVIVDISRRPDGSMWSIGERVRFVTEFAKRVYQRQGEQRRPLHLVIDEAARFAPQIVRQGEIDVAKCMGAVAVIVEEGRNVGIGVTLVTQRSARLNKDVAELADCMIAFRIVGPNSMRAVLDWLGEHVDKGRLKEISQQLRELPRGTALVVSPGWLEFEGIAPMRKRETFDSSATPKPGQQVRASGPGAKPDLAKYRERLAEVVERAKAEDPKVLRAKIAELVKERDQLARAIGAGPSAKPGKAKVVEKLIVSDAQIRRVELLNGAVEKTIERALRVADATSKANNAVVDASKNLHEAMSNLLGSLAAARQAPIHPDLAATIDARYGTRLGAVQMSKAESRAAGLSPRPSQSAIARSSANVELEPRQVRALQAVAWWASIGVRDPEASNVAFVSGNSPTSSSWEKIRGMLRSNGLIDYPRPGAVCLTDAGAAIAPPPSAPPSRAELHAAVLDQLKPVQRRMMEPLLSAWPDPVDAAELGVLCKSSHTSSSFEKVRGRLRSLGIAEYPRPGLIKASDLLFPTGLR